ncbi:hypothetical protein HMPREF0782_1112 [Staphylococcus aureus subsp. aureus ATCC 51811]|nr:hypothetical protein HMPREF0782_1112 [Staphylococcus aureus subsp. aureus ATCC 51811]
MTERKCTCNKHFSIKVRGPNTEAGGKSAYNNVQVGGAPTQKLTESQLTIMWKLGSDDEINFAKISFLSHLTQNKFHYP